MKPLGRFSIALALALTLASAAFAGDIHIPEPPQPPASATVIAPGEISLPGDIYIGLLRSLLSIF